MVDLVERPELK
jgi:hypothetical protein